MTKPGPSKEYRDLIEKRISPDEYVEKVKKDVDRRLHEKRTSNSFIIRDRRAATG